MARLRQPRRRITPRRSHGVAGLRVSAPARREYDVACCQAVSQGHTPGVADPQMFATKRVHELAENRALVKGQIRHNIGQFARSFAASTNEKRKESKATRATSVAPTRSFDQIDELSKEDVPWGAGLSKQRTSSEGGHLYRFKGQLVR